MGGELRRWLAAYATFTRAHLLKLLQYRTSFFIGIAAVACRHLAGVLTLWVIFSKVRALGGWSVSEALFLYGFVSLVNGVHHLFFMNTFRVEYMVQNAQLDRYLCRPLPVLLQIMLFYFDDDALGDIVPAVAILAVAGAQLEIDPSPDNLLILGGGLLGGVLVFLGLHLVLCSWSFWFVKSRALIQLFGEVRRFSEYPLHIFPPAIQLLLTLVIPIAFAAYYPVARLVGEGVPGKLALFSLPVGVVAAAFGALVFRAGLRRYQSTGS